MGEGGDGLKSGKPDLAALNWGTPSHWEQSTQGVKSTDEVHRETALYEGKKTDGNDLEAGKKKGGGSGD